MPAATRRTSAIAICTCPRSSSGRCSRRSRCREDRDEDGPLFPGLLMHGCAWRSRGPVGSAECRTFSPHSLRRRRGALHYKRTGSLAEVAEILGDSKRVAAEHYVYALTDYGVLP